MKKLRNVLELVKEKGNNENSQESFYKGSCRRQCLIRADNSVEFVPEVSALKTHGQKVSFLISLPHHEKAWGWLRKGNLKKVI